MLIETILTNGKKKTAVKDTRTFFFDQQRLSGDGGRGVVLLYSVDVGV